MSKIEPPKVDTTPAQTPSKGCGCGHHKHAKEPAGDAPAANPAPSSEHAAHKHARDPDHGSGCCGGSKTQK